MLRIYAISVMSFFISLNSMAASFDCNKASTKIEKLICSDSEVGYLDEELAKVYNLKMKSLPDDLKKVFRNQQREWIKIRNKKCDINGYACAKSYTKRIPELMAFEIDKTPNILLDLIKGVWQISGAYGGKTAWYNNAILITDNEIITLRGSKVDEALKFTVEEVYESSLILKTKKPASKRNLKVENVFFRFNLNQCSTKGISTTGGRCYDFNEGEVFGFCMYTSLEGARNRNKNQCYRGATYYRYTAWQYKEFQEMNDLL